MPGTRYLHYLTTHMQDFANELAELGLDVVDFSTISSEYLQKVLRQDFARATNFDDTAPLQAAKRQFRLQRAQASLKTTDQERIQNSKKETRRLASWYSKHRCTDVLRSWLPDRVKFLVKNGSFSQDDVAGINMDDLLSCPFCKIGGEKIDQKLGVRTKTHLANDTGIHGSSEDETENEDPTWVQPTDGKNSEESDSSDDDSFFDDLSDSDLSGSDSEIESW